MLLVTGISHFTKTDLMMATMPESLPRKEGTRLFDGSFGIAGNLRIINKPNVKVNRCLPDNFLRLYSASQHCRQSQTS